ncbi:MAG: class I SAM-dependent methyltransferase [Bdellovibrionaceae bacterium]|jgi:predicted nicotinamide N-methyase|nr:class I SAM-dependent methyltransferase [Pseudobdellovibrionaceae bacterium]
MNLVKQIHDFKYYTGAHPEVKNCFKKEGRPTEFGNKVWATSLVLLNHLEEQKSDLSNLRVLEIGCGWGLLGVYLAKQFHCQVTCTDFDESVLPIVQLHAKLNTVTVKTKKAAFSEIDIEYLKNFDLIVGAEVCYSEEVAVDVYHLIDRAKKANIKQIFIADPGRPGFLDCYEYCKNKYTVKLTDLQGTINGKTTKLLTLQ